MPCTQLYSGASVATEAREFIYSLGCMFVSNFWLTPTQVLSSVSPGSWPIDHSGHASLSLALLSAFVSQWPGTFSPILSV